MLNGKIFDVPGIGHTSFKVQILDFGLFDDNHLELFDEDIARFCLNLAIQQGSTLKIEKNEKYTSVLLDDQSITGTQNLVLVRKIVTPLIHQLNTKMKEVYGAETKNMINPVTRIKIRKRRRWGLATYTITRKAGAVGHRRRYSMGGPIDLNNDEKKENL